MHDKTFGTKEETKKPRLWSMDTTFMKNPKLRKRASCSGCLRYVTIIISVLYILVGAGLIAGFLYLILTQLWIVKGLLGTDMAVAAAALLVAAGGVLLLSAVLGLIGGCGEYSSVLIWYLILLGLSCLTALAGVVCCLVFRSWLSERVREDMVYNLQNYYGVNLQDSWNKQVTTSWDEAQSQWRCCSVRDNSWAIYKSSAWYRRQPGTPGTKPQIPESCCVLDARNQYQDKVKCQTELNGPPNIPETPQYSGNYNNALYYRGCYESAKDHLLNELTWYIIGFGAGAAFVTLCGVLLGIGLLVMSKRDKVEEVNMLTELGLSSSTQVQLQNQSRSYASDTYPNYRSSRW